MDSDKYIDLYYDHYKETYRLSKEAQVRRNKEFIIVCILETISFLMIGNKDFVMELFNAVATKELETAISFDTAILQSLSWILIAYFWVRYIQDTLYVERQYGYLELIEREMSSQLTRKIHTFDADIYWRMK